VDCQTDNIDQFYRSLLNQFLTVVKLPGLEDIGITEDDSLLSGTDISQNHNDDTSDLDGLSVALSPESQLVDEAVQHTKDPMFEMAVRFRYLFKEHEIKKINMKMVYENTKELVQYITALRIFVLVPYEKDCGETEIYRDINEFVFHIEKGLFDESLRLAELKNKIFNRNVVRFNLDMMGNNDKISRLLAKIREIVLLAYKSKRDLCEDEFQAYEDAIISDLTSAISKMNQRS
jgi:hypothetical protein